MMPDRQQDNFGQRGLAGAAGDRVAPLSQLNDYEIADGYPDIRGWEVKEGGGKKVGDVHELLIDTSELRVRYLDVELDRAVAGAGGDRHVLIPVGNVTLDDRDDDVVLQGIGASQLSGLTPYTHSGVTREYEMTLLSGLGLGAASGREAEFYGTRHFDDSRLFSGRRPATRHEEAAQVTRAEEELAVGKRRVQAGEVGVRKTVETEHVRQQVPVTREEVEIERRPIEAGADVGRRDLREEEIRVPLMAEEVVAEKRVVPKEQVIIRKRPVTQQRTVEADIRKERIDLRPGDKEARP
ncbi:MAG: DUF2382 domain-containing protein [Gemmatimonadota bacterium]|nr:DUF2382 domain-containing protein [Gemmatimonadota bacterium]